VFLKAKRALVAEHAQRLAADGLAVGTAGNLSVSTGEMVAITPSAVTYEELTDELVCVVGLDGRVYAGAKPSTELPLHLALYRERGEGAIVHTHSPNATALGLIAHELPAVHYLVADLGGPVRVAPYAPPASEQLAHEVHNAIAGRNAVLMRNHGAITVGETLETAYDRALLLEWLCGVYLRARTLGEPALLHEDELGRLAAHVARYRA
jgi:L-fuculose-phosphate aldolase